MFCFVFALQKIKSKMHHSNFTSTWVGNCGTCWLSPVMYSISIALCALITCLFYEQCKMGLECECSGSLSHQTPLTLCTEPVHIHQVAYTLHSPVCTHVSVCACLKERPCVGCTFRWICNALVSLSVCICVPEHVQIHVFVCTGVHLLTPFPLCESEGNSYGLSSKHKQ